MKNQIKLIGWDGKKVRQIQSIKPKNLNRYKDVMINFGLDKNGKTIYRNDIIEFAYAPPRDDWKLYYLVNRELTHVDGGKYFELILLKTQIGQIESFQYREGNNVTDSTVKFDKYSRICNKYEGKQFFKKHEFSNVVKRLLSTQKLSIPIIR